MSRKCELSGVGVLFGNKVSHSERKTRKKFKPNIKSVVFYSELLKTSYRLKVSTSAIRTVEKLGGLDNYLLKIHNSLMSDKVTMIKKQLLKLIKASA